MSNDLVSIVTPAYQCGSVVGDAIYSVLMQTYPHWEMLVIDDCSSDNTNDVLREFIKKDRRIRLIENTKNVGPAMSRNVGLASSNGRWIAFLDSDDIWLPEKL